MNVLNDKLIPWNIISAQNKIKNWKIIIIIKTSKDKNQFKEFVESIKIDESIKLFGCNLTVFDLKKNWKIIKNTTHKKIESEKIEIQFQLPKEDKLSPSFFDFFCKKRRNKRIIFMILINVTFLKIDRNKNFLSILLSIFKIKKKNVILA